MHESDPTLTKSAAGAQKLMPKKCQNSNNKRAGLRHSSFRLDETRDFNKTGHFARTRHDVRSWGDSTIIYYKETTTFKVCMFQGVPDRSRIYAYLCFLMNNRTEVNNNKTCISEMKL